MDKPNIINKWIVLDGAGSALWADQMNKLLSDSKTLSLANGQRIVLKGRGQTQRFFFFKIQINLEAKRNFFFSKYT